MVKINTTLTGTLLLTCKMSSVTLGNVPGLSAGLRSLSTVQGTQWTKKMGATTLIGPSVWVLQSWSIDWSERTPETEETAPTVSRDTVTSTLPCRAVPSQLAFPE
jgi:hypothetical protein